MPFSLPIIVFLLFAVIPLAEIAVFIVVGDFIGIPATIAVVIITAFIGTILLKRQGLSVLQRAQLALQEGRIPVESVIDGVCLLVAGAFLLTPGIITDTVGLLLFIPHFRRWLAQILFRQIIQSGRVKFSQFEYELHNHPDARPGQNNKPGPIIDIEPNEVSSETDTPTSGHQGSDTNIRRRTEPTKGIRRRKSPWNKTPK